jgi:predicted enzyme related to lactoylglutathione lyase
MKIALTSVMVTDQAKALAFYTTKLGFVKRKDIPMGGGARWLTVVSPEGARGVELLLEPLGFAPARKFQAALFKACIPATAFATKNVQKEYAKLCKRGVKFTTPPTPMGPTIVTSFDDTCGNLIQLFEA